MMNIQNLNLQGSIGIKYINSIYAKLCLKRCLKEASIFVILMSQGGFRCDSETKVPNNESLHKVSSEAAICKWSSK